MTRPALLAALAAASHLWLLTPGPATPSPQTSPTPRRIVSLVPAVTEMLFAMGAGDLVVGVSSFDTFPPDVASRPRVGALVDPDVERTLALRPDLVIVYDTQDDLIAQLARAEIPLYRYRHGGLPDITDTIRHVGERVGLAAAADDVAAGIERDLDEVRQRVARRPRPKTALIFGRDPGTLRGLFASGGVGFLHDMLEIAGGSDVFADVAQQNLQISTETLLARAPDVILEVHPAAGWTPERIARERSVWQSLASLPAVRRGRVHILADDRLSVPGPRVAEAVRLMARTLHPDAFGQRPSTGW